MNSKIHASKICLGSANFGLSYGLKKKPLSIKKMKKINYVKSI